MLFAIVCIDKPEALGIRKSNREDHMAHVKGSNGAVVQAGPFLDSSGQIYGSLVIYEADDISTAQAWADADPYTKAGAFQSISVHLWNRVLG